MPEQHTPENKRQVTYLMQKVNHMVYQERERQNSKWGHQRHDFGDWLMILTEEVGEAAQAMQRGKGWGKSTDADNLLEELIHVSAVASAIAEQVLEMQMIGKWDGTEETKNE